jgi:flavin-dependent dehydrogenase
MMDFDVLIIGGSLGGSSAALALKDSGLKVGIIDKANFPRRKPCGEGLSGRGLEALRGLGIPLNELLGLGKLFKELVVESNGISTHIAAPDGFGLGIARWKLDNFILDKAKHFATLINDEVLDVSPIGDVLLKSTKLSAKVIIIADGNGKLTQSLNPSSDTHTRAGVSASFSGNSINSVDKVFVRICDAFEIYVTPLDSHTVNVAVLGTINSDRNIRDVLLSGELYE